MLWLSWLKASLTLTISVEDILAYIHTLYIDMAMHALTFPTDGVLDPWAEENTDPRPMHASAFLLGSGACGFASSAQGDCKTSMPRLAWALLALSICTLWWAVGMLMEWQP